MGGQGLDRLKKHTSKIYEPKARKPSVKDRKRAQRREYRNVFVGKHGGFYGGPRKI